MNTPENQAALAVKETQAVTIRPTLDQVPVAAMLQAVIDRGVTGDSVIAVKELVTLYEHQQDRQAEREFAAAFAALQSALPQIVASSVIPNRGKYEKYEDVMHVLRPLLIKHGFAVAFSQSADDKRITQVCTVSHIGGHSRSNSFAVRLGGKADSDTQADCKASTTAKRNALLNAFDIVIRQDCLQGEDDAGNEGAKIDFAQAETLREMVKETKSDESAFLRYAGAATFEEIGTVKYDMLFRALDAKRVRK